MGWIFFFIFPIAFSFVFEGSFRLLSRFSYYLLLLWIMDSPSFARFRLRTVLYTDFRDKTVKNWKIERVHKNGFNIMVCQWIVQNVRVKMEKIENFNRIVQQATSCKLWPRTSHTNILYFERYIFHLALETPITRSYTHLTIHNVDKTLSISTRNIMKLCAPIRKWTGAIVFFSLKIFHNNVDFVRCQSSHTHLIFAYLCFCYCSG